MFKSFFLGREQQKYGGGKTFTGFVISSNKKKIVLNIKKNGAKFVFRKGDSPARQLRSLKSMKCRKGSFRAKMTRRWA